MDPEERAVLVEDVAGTPVAVGAIADGSQVIAHDGYDVQVWREALKSYTRLAKLAHDAEARLVTAPALLRDLFWSFYKRLPRIAPPAPLTQAYALNREMVEQILATVEWKQVREAGTVGDILASALATIGVAAKAIAALDDATVARINHLHEMESGAAALFAQAEALDDLTTQAQGDRAQRLFAQARAARDQAQAQEQQAHVDAEMLAQDEEQREDAVRRAARPSLLMAEQQIDNLNAAINAYGGGSGMGAGRPLTTKEKLHLAAQVGTSRRLQEIAALCGRFTRIALDVQRNKVTHPPDEIASITIGRDLGHILPAELALLADPDLEDLFFLKFAESRLMQYDLVGSEKQGQGPIIVALDNSGSMTESLDGTLSKEVWSKAVTLAFLAIARRQKRDMAVIHFSDPGQLTIHQFPKGRGEHADVIACCDHFFGNGTVFEPWMRSALQLVRASRFAKADVICVSDGLASIDQPTRAEWNQVRKERGMRAYSVLIGTDEGLGLLAAITDAVLTLTDLDDQAQVFQAIFSV